MSKDLMLDIETLDTKPTALVLSLGLVWFDFDNPEVVPYEGKHHKIELRDQQRELGRTISVDTVMWWMEQSKQAQLGLSSPFTERTPVATLHGIVEGAVQEADRIWAKGPDFDCVILANMFPAIKWPFWKHRDVRTILDVARIKERRFEGIAHNALDDSINQANALREAVAKLRGNDNVAG